MRTYVCGPMSNLPGLNLAAFDFASDHLRSLGFEPVNPADIGRHYGFDAHSHVGDDEKKQLLLMDLEALSHCEALLLLSGWERSKGAAVEIAFARYAHIPVFESITDLLAYREGKAA